jgi:hypothetical protein
MDSLNPKWGGSIRKKQCPVKRWLPGKQALNGHKRGFIAASAYHRFQQNTDDFQTFAKVEIYYQHMETKVVSVDHKVTCKIPCQLS